MTGRRPPPVHASARHDAGRRRNVKAMDAQYYTGSGAAFSRSMLNRLLTLRSFTWLIRRR